MMIRGFLFTCLMLLLYPVPAQQPRTSVLYDLVTKKRQALKTVDDISLFQKSVAPSPAAIKNILSTLQLLTLNRNESRKLFKKKSAGISFFVPFQQGGYRLELIQEDISTGGSRAGKLTGDNNKRGKTALVKALHYRGYIKNDPTSIASVSVFENGDIMCLFADATGNYNLGKTADGRYIVYNSIHMKRKPGFECGTDETPVPANSNNENYRPMAPLAGELCNKVRIYWEVDYELYNQNFSNNFNNTVNYLSGLFNQMAVMYLNESIIVELSELYIWTSPDPFNTTSSTTGLDAIKTKWNTLGNNFNGDLCMLIDGGISNNGGRAYLSNNNICNRTFAYGYSRLEGFFNNVPAYSWDLEVVTHETGHQLGSNHTHWCGWNTGAGGTCGAIDDCVTVQTTTSCTTCSATTITNPTMPIGFTGTVMSYCHLRSDTGINLANGFGPLPGAKIRSNVSNSSCTVKENNWTGAVDTAWEKPANWSCGSIPTINTDVIIPGGLTNYPVVNSTAICRKLIQEPNTSVRVRQGFTLNVAGRD